MNVLTPRGLLLGAAAFGVALFAFSSAPGWGDTNWYTSDVLTARSGNPTDARVLWEFGHVVWRPIGALLFPLAQMIPDAVAAGPKMKLAWMLAVFSAACGILAAMLMYNIVFRLSKLRWLAFLVSIELLCADACLTYFKTGNSYVPGLFFVTLALWLTIRSVQEPNVRWALLAGISLAIATLFWFTNVLFLPPLLVAALVWNTPDWRRSLWLSSGRIKLAASVAGGFVVILIAGYAMAVAAAGIRSFGELIAWYRSADHGWAQNRTALRAVSGLPRMIFDLSNDGVALKRYVFHDPYSPVRLPYLIGAVFWKIAAFYLCLALMLWRCLRGKRQQEAGIVFFTALASAGFFAIVLFEPSTPSRFISLLPFWFLALTLASLAPRAAPFWRAALLGVPLVAAAVNVGTFTFANSCSGPSTARFDRVRNAVKPGDVTIAITNQDDLYRTADQCRLQPSDGSAGPVVVALVDPSNRSAAGWRDFFAQQTMETWNRGNNVWIPKRLLAATPLPNWNWTEGDNPLLRWSDFPACFRALRFDADTGGPDGFLRLAHNPEVEAQLRRLVAVMGK